MLYSIITWKRRRDSTVVTLTMNYFETWEVSGFSILVMDEVGAAQPISFNYRSLSTIRNVPSLGLLKFSLIHFWILSILRGVDKYLTMTITQLFPQYSQQIPWLSLQSPVFISWSNPILDSINGGMWWKKIFSLSYLEDSSPPHVEIAIYSWRGHITGNKKIITTSWCLQKLIESSSVHSSLSRIIFLFYEISNSILHFIFKGLFISSNHQHYVNKENGEIISRHNCQEVTY